MDGMGLVSRQRSSVLLRPLFDGQALPYLAHVQHVVRLRKVLPRRDLLCPLPADTEHLGYLVGAHEVARERGPEGYTLDRYPDNDGNYEPGNVRWATRSEQLLNTTRHFEAVRRAAVPRRPRVANPKAEALRILATDPGISGADLARQLGVTDRYGAALKKRLTATASTGSEE